MEQKFSDTYRTSFLTLDRYLQQSNSAQFYFRPLLPPLNTVSGEFYSLSPAQGTDPSIRINKYSSNGTFLGFGYLYDTSFNVPPADGSGGTVDISGGYWTLTGSNIYNNNPGFVGVGTVAPAAALDVSGSTRIRGPALSNLLFVGDASLNNPSAEQDTVKIGTAGVGGRLAIGDDGKGVLRLLNAFGDSYIETGTNMAVGSSGRLIFSSMFDLSGGPTMTVNTGTDEVVISNQFIDAPVPNYKLTVDGSANVLGNLRSEHHLPQSSYTYDLGSSSAYWRDLYLSTGTIYMGPTGTIGGDSSGNIIVNQSNGKGLGINTNAFVLPIATAICASGDVFVGTTTNRMRMAISQADSATYIQTNATNGFRFTPEDSGTTVLSVKPSTNQVGINTTAPTVALDVSGAAKVSGNLTVDTNTLFVDAITNRVGMGTITPLTTLGVNGQATVALDISYANRAANPLTSQLILQGQTTSGRLLMGAYYTPGGVASTIQSSDVFGSGDNGANLLLNPLGGNVGINMDTPTVALDVSGNISTNGTVYSGNLSTGTIYMGPSSSIRSSNPLTLDLSGNAGLYVTSNTTVGRVYDTAFNPAPALAPRTITPVLTVSSVAVNVVVTPTLAMGGLLAGNYIVKQVWTFGVGTVTTRNIFTAIDPGLPTSSRQFVMIPPIPTVTFLADETTYTLFTYFNPGTQPNPQFQIDTTDLAPSDLIISTTVSVSVLFLSPST